QHRYILYRYPSLQQRARERISEPMGMTINFGVFKNLSDSLPPHRYRSREFRLACPEEIFWIARLHRAQRSSDELRQQHRNMLACLRGVQLQSIPNETVLSQNCCIRDSQTRIAHRQDKCVDCACRKASGFFSGIEDRL